MRLRILLPANVLLDEAASKIVAEAPNGSFCLLPKHRDFVTSLVPDCCRLSLNPATKSLLRSVKAC